MTDLAEVYHRRDGPGYHVGRRRMLLGVGLFLLGAVMAVVGLVIASTEILSAVGIGRFASRRLAGVLGGLGVPAVFIGILTVLPASKRIRLAAGMGAGIAVIGVALFWVVYPDQWLGAPNVTRHYTFETTAIYFIGALLTFWCLFVGIANFKTRNDPGGTVDFEVRKAGRTKVVEVDATPDRQAGGLGVLGGLTGEDDVTVSDGGEATVQQRQESDQGVDILSEDTGPDPVDRYCGNCEHFEYTPSGNGMQPYCGYRDEEMDDMEPCSQWVPREDR